LSYNCCGLVADPEQIGLEELRNPALPVTAPPENMPDLGDGDGGGGAITKTPLANFEMLFFALIFEMLFFALFGMIDPYNLPPMSRNPWWSTPLMVVDPTSQKIAAGFSVCRVYFTLWYFSVSDACSYRAILLYILLPAQLVHRSSWF